MGGKLRPINDAKISFPGWQRVLDFVATGSESSKDVTVAGDTDREFLIIARNLTSGQSVNVKLNNDSGAAKYGQQYLYNGSGTLSAGRDTGTFLEVGQLYTSGCIRLSTNSGFLKCALGVWGKHSSGTTISQVNFVGWSYNATANITSLNFYCPSGNWTAGTKITVLVRRA